MHGVVDVTGIAFTDPNSAAAGPGGLASGVLITLPLTGYALLLLRHPQQGSHP